MHKPSKRLEGAHREAIWSVCWTSAGGVLTGALDGSTKLWNGDLELQGESAHQNMGITSVVPFNDGSKAVTCCQDGNISFLGLPSMLQEQAIAAGLQEAWTVCLSPGNDVIASGTHSGSVNIWSVSDCTKAVSIETGCGFIMNSAFHPDGAELATTGTDGILNIIDIATQRVAHKIDAHSLPTRCVKYFPDGDLIMTASDDRHVCVFDTRSGTVINSFSHSGMALYVDISPNQKNFAVGCSNHTVAIWDIGMQRVFQTMDSQHTEPVWSVSYSADGQRLASVGDDGLIQLYECH